MTLKEIKINDDLERFEILTNSDQILLKNIKIGNFNKIYIYDCKSEKNLDTILVKSEEGL